MIPSEPSEPNIAVTLATTLMSGMNGMLPSPRTSRMIAKAATLTPTSASAPAHAFTLLSISITKYLLLVYDQIDRVVFKYTQVYDKNPREPLYYLITYKKYKYFFNNRVYYDRQSPIPFIN